MVEIKTVGHVIGCRIARVECRETERGFAKLDDADVRVERFGNSLPGVGTQHQTTHARAITELGVRIRQTVRGITTCPGIFERRLNVVVPTAPVVPGDDDGSVVPVAGVVVAGSAVADGVNY